MRYQSFPGIVIAENLQNHPESLIHWISCRQGWGLRDQVQIMTTGFLGIGHVSSNWSCSQESSSQNLNRENELDDDSIDIIDFMDRLPKDVLQSVSYFQVRT